MTKVSKTVSVIFVVICAMALAYFSCVKSIEARLDTTLDTLLKEKMGLSYEILQVQYLYYGLDASAAWWVLLNDESKDRTVPILKNNLVPWEDEIELSTNFFKSKFEFQGNLNEYKLYELDIPLGPWTICETKDACNYYLLKKEGEPNLFVRIVKF